MYLSPIVQSGCRLYIYKRILFLNVLFTNSLLEYYCIYYNSWAYSGGWLWGALPRGFLNFCIKGQERENKLAKFRIQPTPPPFPPKINPPLLLLFTIKRNVFTLSRHYPRQCYRRTSRHQAPPPSCRIRDQLQQCSHEGNLELHPQLVESETNSNSALMKVT